MSKYNTDRKGGEKEWGDNNYEKRERDRKARVHEGRENKTAKIELEDLE